MSQALWEAMGLGDDDADESEVFLVNTTVPQTVWHAVGLGDNSDDDVAPTVAVSLCTAVVLSEPTSDARADLASSTSPLHRLPSSADVTPLASSSSPMHSLQSLGDDAQPSPGVTRIPPVSESLGTNNAGSTIPREPDPPPRAGPGSRCIPPSSLDSGGNRTYLTVCLQRLVLAQMSSSDSLPKSHRTLQNGLFIVVASCAHAVSLVLTTGV